MKKLVLLLMISVIICLLCACKENSEPKAVNSEDSNTSDNENKQSSETPKNADGSNILKNEKMYMIDSFDAYSACNTENGYYYLSSDMFKLKDGSYGKHLMYVDFASCQEIYLCSTASCKHDSIDCPAVFLCDEFYEFSTKLFVIGDNLYILSRKYDDDGTLSQMILGDDITTESRPATLYRAKLDGTERKKIYTFDSDLTIEDKLFGGNNGIYLITKKLSTENNGSFTSTFSSERKLIYLDLKTLSEKEICHMEFDDNISWTVIGCANNTLVLSGIDFGRKISVEEIFDDDVYKEMFYSASEVYAVLDMNSGKLKEICRVSNKNDHSAQLAGDNLYLSYAENHSIEEINLETGEKKTICTLSQNLILNVIGDMLCCRDWNLSDDYKYYFVNTKTGEIINTPLVNLCNGWEIEFRAETSSDVLIIYDYDADKFEDGSYEIHQNKFALMAKDDLFSGRDNYKKIKMVGSGK